MPRYLHIPHTPDIAQISTMIEAMLKMTLMPQKQQAAISCVSLKRLTQLTQFHL